MDALSAPFSLAQQRLGLFSIAVFPQLCHIPSLAEETMETKTCILL
jgi:hypothetical protein